MIEPFPVVDNLANSRQNNGDITETDSSLFFPLDENSHSFPELTAQITNFGILENLNTVFESSFLPENWQSIPVLIAAPENFNPQLRLSSQRVSPPQAQPTSTVQPTSQLTSTTSVRPAVILESILAGCRR
ncbi:MAG: hypothetical protein ACLBM2_21580, partial [Dolichospermum sp.]